MRNVLTVCPFAGCGCGIYAQVDGDMVTGMIPSFSHPVTDCKICLRGWHAHELVLSRNRLRTPLLRQGGKLVPTSWEEALGAVAKGLSEASQRDPVGVLGSARITNEDNYILMRLARAVLHTNHVDYSASALAPELFGNGHAPMAGTITDLAQAKVILICGSDTAEQNPKAASLIMRALEAGAKLIVISPWREQMSKLAHIYLQVRPGCEVTAISGLLKVMVEQGLVDNQFVERCQGYAELLSSLKQVVLPQVAKETGLSVAALQEAARTLASAKPSALVYSTRATSSPSAAAIADALRNLALVSGNESSRVSFLAPECNFQGAADMGMMPGYLPGYQPVSDVQVRAKFEAAWKAKLPLEPGLPVWEQLGQVKAMLVMGDNPVVSLGSPRAASALQEMGFLVVADLFLTETAELAQVVLPLCSSLELDGTFTSTDRRVQRVRAAAKPVGESRSGWEIASALVERMESPFGYDSASAIMAEIALLTPLYQGCNYQALEQGWGRQWPPSNGRAEQFAAVPSGGSGDALTDERPFVVAVDPTLNSWDMDAAVRNCWNLAREYGIRRGDFPKGFVQINSVDAADLGVRRGQPVTITSAHGEAKLPVMVTDEVAPKTLLVPGYLRPLVAEVLGDEQRPVYAACAVSVRRS